MDGTESGYIFVYNGIFYAVRCLYVILLHLCMLKCEQKDVVHEKLAEICLTNKCSQKGTTLVM